MQVVISNGYELSIFGWIMVVTASIFLMLVLIMFVNAIVTFITQTSKESDDFITEEINNNHGN